MNVLTLSDGSSLTLSGGNALTLSDAAYGWDLEALINGIWLSIARDVMIWDYPLVSERGISGTDALDRVASPGSLTCTLDNSEANSAGLLGYYSPDHANMRAGFGQSTRVRLKISGDGQHKYIWHGWIDDLDPAPGQFKNRTTSLTAFDYMQKLLDHKLSRIPVQESKRSDQDIQTVLDNVATAPQVTSLETDTYTTQLSLHSEQDERSTAMSALQKICQSALGYAFVRGDAAGGETFVFELESTRYQAVSSADLDDIMSDLKLSRARSHYANKVIALLHPVNVDTGGDTVLAQLADEFDLDAGETETIAMRYRDPNGQSVRISGKDIVDPLIADTHFKMSSVADDGGNDLNANLDIDLTIGGNATDAQVTNTGGTNGHINKLNIVGNGIYQYDPLEYVIESGNGDTPLTYDFFYQDDYYRVKDLAAAIHLRVSTQTTHVESVVFYADASDTLMGYAINCDIGTRVHIVETATGLDDYYIINKVTYTIQTDGRLKVDWLLTPANSADFFQLDADELDGAAVLSPFT